MQQIADWLEKLGMSEYAERFAEKDIDFEVLSELTDQDLKDLGVSSLGHRRAFARDNRNGERSGAIANNLSAPAHAERRGAARNRGRSRRRAALSHGDVLRPGRFNGDFGAT